MKYEFTGEKKIVRGHLVHRIRALEDGCYAHFGSIGGWIESPDNLHQTGNCWISDDDNSIVFRDSCVTEDAYVNASIIFGQVEICGSASVSESIVSGQTSIRDEVMISDSIIRDCVIEQTAKIVGPTLIRTKVYGSTEICQNLTMKDGDIGRSTHHYHFGPVGVYDEYATIYRCSEEGIMVNYGRFNGTVDEFLKELERRHGEDRHTQVFKLNLQAALLQINSVY